MRSKSALIVSLRLSVGVPTVEDDGESRSPVVSWVRLVSEAAVCPVGSFMIVISDSGYSFLTLTEEAIMVQPLRFTLPLPHRLTRSNSPVVLKYGMAIILKHGMRLFVIPFLCHQLAESCDVMAKIGERCWWKPAWATTGTRPTNPALAWHKSCIGPGVRDNTRCSDIHARPCHEFRNH